jgi:hypothetical protein
VRLMLTRRIYRSLLAIGIDPRKTLDIMYLPKYWRDKRTFVRAGGNITHYFPVLGEFKKEAGEGSGHYFHQDLLVAGFVYRANPVRHIDVGSSIYGFVSHVASFRPIEVFDVRPLSKSVHQNILSRQVDLINIDSSYYEICDSLSCLHALEHFGLGRYGDAIDPEGHVKGFLNLSKMLQRDGKLYISVPIGKSEVHFNGHRIFDPSDIVNWSEGIMRLLRFDHVDDLGDLHLDQSLCNLPRMKYGCGIYTLQKL